MQMRRVGCNNIHLYGINYILSSSSRLSELFLSIGFRRLSSVNSDRKSRMLSNYKFTSETPLPYSVGLLGLLLCPDMELDRESVLPAQMHETFTNSRREKIPRTWIRLCKHNEGSSLGNCEAERLVSSLISTVLGQLVVLENGVVR
jgi:hypothetical protein